MELFEKKVRNINRYQGIVVNIRVEQVELPNGARTMREVVEHPGGAAIVPIDADGNVYCVRQYRYPFGKTLLEIPAGKLEPGEDPADCAVRELGEETGLIAGRMTPLGLLYTSPGFSDEVLYLYLAQELTQGQAHPDPNEFVNMEKHPIGELTDMISRGEIRDAKTQVGILKAKLILEE